MKKPATKKSAEMIARMNELKEMKARRHNQRDAEEYAIRKQDIMELDERPARNHPPQSNEDDTMKKPATQRAGDKIKLMPRAFMKPWDKQPRKHFPAESLNQLVASLKAVGQMQAVLVRPLAQPQGEVTHEIIMGERRWRASEAAGLDYLEVRVVTLDDKEALEVALMENIERQDLDMIEEAEAFAAMLREGWTVEEMESRMGRKKTAIYESINLTKLDPKTQDALRGGEISRKVGEALGNIEELRDREEALNKIVHPTYQKQPLAREDALRLVNNDYLRPQKLGKEWEGTKKKLVRKYPNQKVFGWREFLDAGGDYVNIGEEIPEYQLAVHARDRVPAWTWEDLADKHNVSCDFAPDEDGKQMRVVLKQALVDLEKAAGEEAPELCIFPLQGKGRHDQGLEHQRITAAARREQAAEIKAVIQDIFQGLNHPPKGWKGKDLNRKAGRLLLLAIKQGTFPGMERMLEELGVDAEKIENKIGVDGVAAALMAWAVMCLNPEYEGFAVELDRLRAIIR